MRHALITLLIAAGAMPAAAQVEGFDADGDGRISRTEYIVGRAAQFDRADRDRDGYVTAADYPQASQSTRASAALTRLLDHADRNHDGRVTREEFGTAGTPLFDKADKDGNGLVDGAEVAALRSALSDRR